MIASLSSAILDCLLKPGLLGAVHSVFDRAVNIKLADTQRIVALTFAQAGGLPYALMLANEQVDSFIKIGVKMGQEVNLDGEQCLEIREAGLRFNLSQASIWSPGMENLSNPEDVDAFLDLVTWSSGYVYQHANHAGLVPLLDNHRLLFEGKCSLEDTPDLRVASLAVALITSLLTALNHRDKKTLASATIKLLGYGIGGTPSGDDLLVGMLAAMHRACHPKAVQVESLLIRTLREQLTDTVTSLLSLTVLRHALAGEFSEKSMKSHASLCILMTRVLCKPV